MKFVKRIYDPKTDEDMPHFFCFDTWVVELYWVEFCNGVKKPLNNRDELTKKERRLVDLEFGLMYLKELSFILVPALVILGLGRYALYCIDKREAMRKEAIEKAYEQYYKQVEECKKQSSDYVFKSGKCYINPKAKETEEECKKQSPDYVFKSGKCYVYLNNQKTK